MGNMKKWNYIISVLMLVIGAGIVVLSSKFKIKFGAGDPGAGFWPMILGVLIILLSIILLLSSMANKSRLEEKTFTIATDANKRVYLIMGVVTVFCVILYIMGFYIAAALFVPAVMYLLEVRNLKKIIVTTVLTLLAIYVVFGILLQITLPGPIFVS